LMNLKETSDIERERKEKVVVTDFVTALIN
jgi:hypothetical protein